jgi:hypothetical protein
MATEKLKIEYKVYIYIYKVGGGGTIHTPKTIKKAMNSD